MTRDGHTAKVIIAEHEGREYLKTERDGTRADNLLSLPHCMSKIVIGNASYPHLSCTLRTRYNAMENLTGPLDGKAARAAFPAYPLCQPTDIPEHVSLGRLENGVYVYNRVMPIRAWQVLIQPFDSDAAAQVAVSALQQDQPVDVSAGYVKVPADVQVSWPCGIEPWLTDCNTVFDVLVLEFEPPAHPWVFAIYPRISKGVYPDHPHLRCDRAVRVGSRLLHGLCIYSASDFAFTGERPTIPELLDQTAVFLAKHIVWTKFQRLLNPQTGELIDKGLGQSHSRSVSANAAWLDPSPLSVDGFLAG